MAQPDWPATSVRVADDPALAEVLAALGLDITDDAQAPIIARAYTPALRDAVQGARLVLLLDAERPRAWRCRGCGRALAGTPWQGDWATSFAWLRKEGPSPPPGRPPAGDGFCAGDAGSRARRRPSLGHGRAVGGTGRGVDPQAGVAAGLGPYGRGQIAVTTFRLDADLVAGNVMRRACWRA
ncbi:MAG: hypothetical protein R2854_02595 [Caldilineaceae bacterium]